MTTGKATDTGKAESRPPDGDNKPVEAAFRNSEQKLRAIFDLSFGFTGLLSPDGIMVEINRSALEFAGLKLEDVKGRYFWEGAWWSHSEAMRTQVKEAVKTAAGGEFVRAEVTGRAKDGSIHYIDFTLKPVPDEAGHVVYLIPEGRDITERKISDTAVLEISRRYHLLFEQAGDGIFVLDTQGKIVSVNEAFAAMHGFTVEQMLKRGLEGLDVEGMIPFPDRLKRIMAGETLTFEVQHYHRDGHIFPLSVTANRVSWGDKQVIVAVHRDMTARKEAELREKVQLQKMMHADKMASLGTMVAGMAHEINNPNMFIMLNAPTLKSILEDTLTALEERRKPGENLRIGRDSLEGVRETAEELFENIIEGSRRIENIVRELKTYARETPDRMDEIVDLNRAVRSAVTLVGSRIRGATDHFEVQYGEGLPELRGNFQRIEQTVINLLTNACEALPDKDRAIKVATMHDGHVVMLQVSDEGAGMPPEVLARIRDPFFTTKRDNGGTGLGVSVISKIIEEHGGAMLYKSEVGAGTTVTVALPSGGGGPVITFPAGTLLSSPGAAGNSGT